MEEQEGKRSPDEEHQNIQTTILPSPPCFPELLVTLFHSCRCGYCVFEQLVRQLRLVSQMCNEFRLELTDLQEPRLRLLYSRESILNVPQDGSIFVLKLHDLRSGQLVIVFVVVLDLFHRGYGVAGWSWLVPARVDTDCCG